MLRVTYVISLLHCFAGFAIAELPMPQWLQNLSNLTSWPGVYPPYIPEPHHNLSAIKGTLLRKYGACSPSVDSEMDCAFDCGQCVAVDDVYTCSPISQTFDDGPSSASATLLDSLKGRRTKSTFFLIGMNVVELPEIVQRENREGHVVAVHTWSHRFLPALSNEDVFAELQWCMWAINASAGVVPRYFRPPYGGVDNRIRDIARQLGLVTVLWDVDTNDWQLSQGTRKPVEILNDLESWVNSTSTKPKWYTFRRRKTHGLLLEHDLSPGNVKVAMSINAQLGDRQKTVAQCIGAPRYQ